MIRKNKWKILISSLVIILPAIAALILKDSFPKQMPGAWYFTWLMPVMLVILNLACIFFTLRDNETAGQSEKILNITFWIVPAISVFSSGIFIALALGLEFNIGMVIFVILGISLILMGNYMPKAVRNRTFGIKIKWTLANDENWAATHRFSGKLWVICGLLTIFLALVPMEIGFILFCAILVAIVVFPIIYSYVFYKRQLADGRASKEDYDSYPKSEKDKKITVISLVSGGVILVLVAIMMFIGSISYTVGDGSLGIRTTFGGSMTLDYDDIESVEYREDGVGGSRVSGYASAKLLFGWFNSDELGDYTRYTYTGGGPAIVIRTGDGILVIADEAPELTRALYDTLLEKVK